MKAFSFQETDRFLPYYLGATARDTLQEFIDIDVTADDLVRILNRNQVYRSLFFRFISKKTALPDKGAKPADGKSKEPDSPTHRLVSLLGMIGSRNLILALRLHRAKEGSFPISADGSVEIKSGDLLKTAIENEDIFARNNLEYSETAYAAGVFFDSFLNVQAKDPSFKKQEDYYKAIVKRSQRTGVIAYLLAAEVSGFTPKYALAAGMLTQSGKMLLATAFPDAYSELERRHEASGKLPALARVLEERAAFGVSHEEVSSHLLRYFDVFRSLVQPVRYFREPYCIKGVDAQNYKFAVLLGLADRMGSIWRMPADEKDPIFNDWFTPATPILKLQKAKLLEIMKRAMNLR
ncbi:MAG: HDOD domain-containing protein [Bdellovibrionota bacterium]